MENKISQNQFLARMKKAKESINQFQNLPTGTYFCLLKQVKYAPSKSGNEMVQFVYKVLEGDCRNREHRNFYMIGSDSDTPFNMLVQDIANLGYPTDEISSMEKMLAMFEQITNDALNVTIRISENPDPKYSQYLRTRIEEVVDVADLANTPEEVAQASTTSSDNGSVAETPEEEKPAEEAPVEESEVIEEEPDAPAEEEMNIDVGTNIEFEFGGKTLSGEIESGAADGLTCVVKCTDGKKRKIKCEKILKVVK